MDSPVQMIRMDKSTGKKRVNVAFFSYLCLSQHRSNDILKNIEIKVDKFCKLIWDFKECSLKNMKKRQTFQVL